MSLVRAFVISATFLLLAACVSEPVRETPSGPSALLRTSLVKHGYKGSDTFLVDSKNIDKYYLPGGGWRVPAGAPITLTLTDRTHYEMPILVLINKIYEVSGETTFTPVADHKYVVTGKLSDSYSGIWIEDEGTKQVVGKKIEVNGSTALGILEK